MTDSTTNQSTTQPFVLHYDDINPLTKLLHKHAEALELQQQLIQQKQYYDTNNTIYIQREQQLKQHDIELQESLIIFNKYLIENNNKINKYTQKTADERGFNGLIGLYCCVVCCTIY